MQVSVQMYSDSLLRGNDEFQVAVFGFLFL